MSGVQSPKGAEMKYIMLEITNRGITKRIPFIFPGNLVHADIASAVRSVAGLEGAEVVSAGECNVEVLSCYGDSDTLKLKADDCDEDIINTIDCLHGIL